MTFVAACAQIAPRKAETAANLDRIAEVIREAADAGADLVLFPETATSGYFLEGGVYESAMSVEALGVELGSRLSGLEKTIDVALGFSSLAVARRAFSTRASAGWASLSARMSGIRCSRRWRQ